MRESPRWTFDFIFILIIVILTKICKTDPVIILILLNINPKMDTTYGLLNQFQHNPSTSTSPHDQTSEDPSSILTSDMVGQGATAGNPAFGTSSLLD